MTLQIFDSKQFDDNASKINDLTTAFQRDGAVVINGIFGNEELERYRSAAEEFSLKRRDGEPRYSPFIHIQRERPEYATLVRDKRLVQYVELLLGSSAEMIQAMFYYKAPGHLGFTKHQDNYYCEVKPPEAMVVAWVAIDDADEENGCLYVYPGSHREPILPVRDLVDPGVGKQSNSFNERDRESIMPRAYPSSIMPVTAGGVGFMHCHLVHESGTNLSESRFRRSVVMDYIRTGAPFRPGNSAQRYRFNLYT